MSTIDVYVPVPPSRNPQFELAPRLRDISGKQFALLDNCKANAGLLLNSIATRLHGGESEAAVFKKNATTAAPAAIISHLRQFDAVVLAIAD